MASLNNSILNLIQCPVCLLHMIPPIFLCSKGHSVCGSCFVNLKKCPKCYAPLMRSRNYMLESIIRELNYPCDFNENGCLEMLKFGSKDIHQSRCSFRFYTCLFNKEEEPCDWTGRRNELYMHVLKNHKDNIHYEKLEVKCNFDEMHDKYMLCALGDFFYVQKKVNLRPKKMHWIVQYIGKFEDVCNFSFEVKIVQETGSRSITFGEPCAHDSQNIDMIIHGNNQNGCIDIPGCVFEKFEDEFKKITLKICVYEINYTE